MTTFAKISLPAPGPGAGNPEIKKPSFLIAELDDILTEPTRETGITEYAEGLSFVPEAKIISLYATPDSIEILETVEGDDGAQGFKKGVKGAYPGDDSKIRGVMEFYLNRPVVIFVPISGTTSFKMIGSQGNPLYLKPEFQDNKDGQKRTFTFQQTIRDRYVTLVYTGVLPAPVPVTPVAAVAAKAAPPTPPTPPPSK